MSALVLPVLNENLPGGFCPSTYQDLLDGFSAVQSVEFPGDFSGVIASAATPAVEDQDKAWLQLDSMGRPIRLYFFGDGAWLSYHTLEPGATIWWFDALPDFDTFDGGDADAPTYKSGPMWQQAVNIDSVVIAAKFPLAAGTLPSGTVLNLGDTGGEENHQLTVEEMPKHKHPPPTVNLPLTLVSRENATNAIALKRDGASDGQLGTSDWTAPVGGKVADTEGNCTAHNTMPLYVVGYLLQRTGRLWFKV